MARGARLFLIIFITLLPFVLMLPSHAKPPQPGPDFVWVAPHTTPQGNGVPGHWKYVGPDKKGKVWVPGHNNPAGEWVPGHWKPVNPRKPGTKWVPGHHGPGGRWIPGHWK